MGNLNTSDLKRATQVRLWRETSTWLHERPATKPHGEAAPRSEGSLIGLL